MWGHKLGLRKGEDEGSVLSERRKERKRQRQSRREELETWTGAGKEAGWDSGKAKRELCASLHLTFSYEITCTQVDMN